MLAQEEKCCWEVFVREKMLQVLIRMPFKESMDSGTCTMSDSDLAKYHLQIDQLMAQAPAPVEILAGNNLMVQTL
jgi:hypothetical protein